MTCETHQSFCTAVSPPWSSWWCHFTQLQIEFLDIHSLLSFVRINLFQLVVEIGFRMVFMAIGHWSFLVCELHIFVSIEGILLAFSTFFFFFAYFCVLSILTLHICCTYFSQCKKIFIVLCCYDRIYMTVNNIHYIHYTMRIVGQIVFGGKNWVFFVCFVSFCFFFHQYRWNPGMLYHIALFPTLFIFWAGSC